MAFIKQMNKLFLFAAVGAAFLVGCMRQGGQNARVPIGQATDSEKPEPVSRVVLEPDWDLYEMVFRMRLPREATDKVIFISLGYDSKSETYRDVPIGFIQRFRDLPYKVHPASAARLPYDDEEVTVEGKRRYRGVEEKTTRKPGQIYFVTIKEKTRDGILLEVGFFGGPLYGGGTEFRATKENGKWQLEFTGSGWVSETAPKPKIDSPLSPPAASRHVCVGMG